ncbi:MAG: hypothetical protein LBP25_02680 [Tannerellaceae bacterium]|jgi:hypothetical protein|nr:hypothetical protein [Tannerellaceae bacterium]
MRKQTKSKHRFFDGKAITLAAFGCLSCSFSSLYAQETADFKPSGSPIIVLFADYTAGIGSESQTPGFSLTRSRLGYSYQLTPSLSAVSVVDINATQNGRGVHFHYAYARWAWKNLYISGGLVDLSQFSEQEAFWGRRYLEKSFQDLNGFGASSDLGITAGYRFTRWFEADASLIRGDDIIQNRTGSLNRLALGATFRPVGGLILRAYLDENRHTSLETDNLTSSGNKNQRTLALFAGYRNARFSIGSEFNYQQSKQFVDGGNYYGLSLYSGVALGRKFDLYARYDYVDTQSPSIHTLNWNGIAHETVFITGLEYHPLKNFQISPNYRYIRSFDGTATHFIGLHAGFSL